jgi:hypothetical protein
MSATDDTLQTEFASVSIPPDRQPTPDEIADLVDGVGPERQRLQTLDRLMSTPHGAAELALVRALRDGFSEGGGGASVVSIVPARSRWWRQAALAAAAVVAIVVGTRALDETTPDRVLRSSDAAVTLIAPRDGATAAGSVTFTWHPIANATYEVEVYSAGGSLVVQRETSDSTLQLQANAVPRGEHRWWVTARLDDGTQVRSTTRRLDVR